jgi:outer membrane cobalamin receptor
MYTLCHRIAVLAILPLLVCPLLAQTAPGADESEVTIIVTAERTPQTPQESIASATVITAKEIRERGAQTAADVLRLVPGVVLRQFGQPGSAATATLRGTKANQTLVLVDGQRLSSSAFIGGTDLSKFPVAEIARIEVIRGPVSSLYGSEAIGGVINIVTKRPTGSAGSAVLGFGANGRAERSLLLNGASDRMSWQLTGSVPAFSGIRPNSDYSATNMSGRIILPSVNGWELALRGEDYHDTLGLPGSLDYPSLSDHQWWNRASLDFTAGRDLGSGRLECRAYRTNQRLRQVNPDWFLDSRITGRTTAGEITYRWQGGAHKLIAGAEYRDEDYEDIEAGSPDVSRGIANRAFFVQDRFALGSRADIVLGTRLDDHSGAGSRVTPRLGVTFSAAPEMRLRASYAAGFRAPSLVERYYTGAYGAGNPDLRPEKSRQYELGVNLGRGDDTIDLAVFTNRVTDQINWVIVDPITWSGTYENIERARQKGFELSWERRLGGGAHFGVSYTYLDARNSATGARLLGIPYDHVGLTAGRRVGSWDIGLTGRWWSDVPDYAGRTVSSRAVFDLSLLKQGKRLTNPYVTIRNLFNVAYEEVAGYPAEGRGIEVGARSSW